jgi:DNA-binding response OmpR family regulator
MPSNEAEKGCIVTIDDDADVREALRIVLETEGFEVHDASNGEAGLALVEQVRPHAVIVDLMMESVDAGSAVARKLREKEFPGPVYLLSSAGDTVRYNIDPKELGLAGVFQKPIQSKALVATLRAKLGR